MYPFNRQDVETRIRIGLISKDLNPIDEVMGRALTDVVLEIIRDMLNYKKPNVDYYLEELQEKIEDHQLKSNICWITELILTMYHEVRAKFNSFGFDNRLLYKIIKKEAGRICFFCIVMDLEATLESMAETQMEEPISIAEEVVENPTAEDLSRIFEQCERTGR